MANEVGPDQIVNKSKPKDGKEDQCVGNTCVQSSLTSLGNVENAIDGAEKPPEIPSVTEQLSRILEIGETAYAMGSFHANMDEHQMEELWNAYLQTIDDFRLAYANLPSLREIDNEYKQAIFKAMRNKDTSTLIEIFDTEAKEYNEPGWEKIPGVKFGKGFFEAGKQLVQGGSILGESIIKAPGIGVSENEKKRARQILKTVGNSLLNFTQFAQNYFRIPEYEAALAKNKFKRSDFDEEIARRYAFDAATFFAASLVKVVAVPAQAAKASGAVAQAARVAEIAGRVILTEVAPEVAEYASKVAARKEAGL
ncbi:MAG: hypothetical protein AAB588_04990 [Patescibacteria group bacterium]|mgnify:CR=1 FL=1